MTSCWTCQKEISTGDWWVVECHQQNHGWLWYFCGSECLQKWAASKLRPRPGQLPFPERKSVPT